MEILGHSDCCHIYGRVKQHGVKEHEHQELPAALFPSSFCDHRQVISISQSLTTTISKWGIMIMLLSRVL